MSTYYKFVCKECNQSGGFLSRQAWGIGNFDIIETFKFLGIHKDHHPYLVSEYEEDYDSHNDISDSKEHCEKFLEDSDGIMPSSNDWKIVNENEWKDVEKIWVEKFKKINEPYFTP